MSNTFQAARHVVSARLQSGGAKVVAWMYMRLSEQCTTLIAPRALPTARQRPGWATLEDLYDSSNFYVFAIFYIYLTLCYCRIDLITY